MVVIKAARAQRARRKKEKPTQSSKHQPPKTTQSNANTNFSHNIDPMLLDARPDSILIDDESNQSITISDNEEKISNQGSECSIFESYNQDLALIDESQQILEWCRDGDKSSDDEAVAKILWPISFSNHINVERQKLKSRGSKYLMPTKNPSDGRGKSVP